MDPFGSGSDRRRIPALEAHIDTLAGLYTLRDSERLTGLGDIHTNGFLAVDMLAGSYGRFEVLHMEEGRGGNLYQVDIPRPGKLFECVRAMKEQPGIDRCASQAGIESVETVASGGKLVGKQIGESDDLGRGVVGE